MVEYDSKLIYQFAESLYKRADGIVASQTIGGLALGFAGGVAIVYVTQHGGDFEDVLLNAFTASGAVIGGLLGFLGAQAKAFHLRLQAQTALCQAKIEENTRPKAG